MFASSSLDATICLRCHLRLALRRIASPAARIRSTPQCIPHSRYQSTEATQEDGHKEEKRHDGYTVRHLRPLVRGRKGRQHREASERLSIDSLGKSSEVIVLRDLPKRKKKAEIKLDASDSPLQATAEPNSSSTLTAKEIEAYADKKSKSASQDDVNASIEKAKPGEDEIVLTKEEFETKAKALSESFNIGQLRGYFKLHLKQFVKSPSSVESQTSVREDAGRIKSVTHTPWHTGVSSIRTRLPTAENARQFSRRMPQKQLAVERILRDCWGLRVEEEEDVLGELEVLLRPDQFGLLLTKNSPALAPLLQSTKFYRNSRFELYQADSVIRIIGPRSEAQVIAATLQDAFRDARRVTIPLDGFPKSWLRDVDTFGHEQLKGIMDVTKTFIEYDAKNERINCASFGRTALEDAYRLLIALLPLPFRNKTTYVQSDIPTKERYLVPFLDKKALPSRFLSKKLSRIVAAVPASKRQKALVSSDTLETLPVVARRVLQLMSVPRPVHGTSEPGPTYWNPWAVASPWKATFGYHLEAQENTPHGSVTVRDGVTTLDNSRPNETFLPRLPGIFSILSQFGKSPSKPLAVSTSESLYSFSSTRTTHDQLDAILIPSPVEELGVIANTAFPTLKFRFTLIKLKSHTPSGQREVRMEVKFKGIEGQLREDHCEVMLPDKSVDLRLERQESMTARYADKDDPNIKAFIEAVKSSVDNDFNLRAPPSLTMRIPGWAIKTSILAEGQKQNVSSEARKLLKSRLSANKNTKVKYLFQGFQHRTSQIFSPSSDVIGGHYFSPDHFLRVDHVEGGVTGGRRIEVSIVHESDRSHAQSWVSKNATTDAATADSDQSLSADVSAGVPMASILRSHTANAQPPSMDQHAETSQLRELLRTSFSVVNMISNMESGGKLSPDMLHSDKQTLGGEQPVPKKASSKHHDRSMERRQRV